jgi:hypothetical protein
MWIDRLQAAIRSERGSALIAAVVLLLIMTILGLALFDLSVLENRLATTSLADGTAFEVAQAGLERAMERLRRTLLTESTGVAGWQNGEGDSFSPLCQGGASASGGCDATQFRLAADSYISGGSVTFASGTYSIAFKLLTVTEAGTNPYGQVCIQGTVGGINYCKDLILVRSSGTVANLPPGYTATRTLQALVRANSTSTFAGGVTAGAPSGRAMHGKVIIAGSINILGDPGTSAIAWGGGSGQRNNWAGLDPTTLSRLTPLPLVCPPGRVCPTDANKVESLGARLWVARPVTTAAVSLSGGAAIGESGDTGLYGSPARRGKGPVDDIGVADGCVMPCTDNFTGATVGSNVHVDGGNITKPYPGAAGNFPRLTDPVSIAGTDYSHYACLPGATGCTVAGSFINPTLSPPRGFDVTANAGWQNSLGSVSGLRDNTASWNTGAFQFRDKNGTTQDAIVCWDQVTLTLKFGIKNPLLVGPPTCLTSIPAPPSNPLLLYTTGNVTVERQGGPTAYNYAGSAIIVTSGTTTIEETFQSFCTLAPCTGERYPEHQMLAIVSNNRIDVGKANANIDRIMVMLYTEGDLYSEKQTNVVGTATAFRFCFGGGSCPASSGGNVPSFFQVPQDTTVLPEELFIGAGDRWSVAPVSRFWVECRPGATATSPATVTGLCGY